MKQKNLDIRVLTKIALCVSMICVSSYLVIPLLFTPIVISLHTVVINLVGLILKPKPAALCISTYLLMGIIGLPVFSAGTSGLGKLLGPTGGYYFGFFFAVIAISLLKGTKINLKRYMMATIFAGLPIQHICAILMMCFHNGFNVVAAFSTVSLPFILGDIAKCVIASFVGVALNKTLQDYA